MKEKGRNRIFINRLLIQ